MQLRKPLVLSAVALLAVVVACQKSAPLSPETPTSPSTLPSDGSTLKVSAPTPQSPVNNVRVDGTSALTLKASTATPSNGGSVTYQYRFQLFNSAKKLVQDSGAMSSTSWSPTANLDFDSQYTWQVRAELNGAVGPWSTQATFLSPNGGFIRGDQVFDPLTNGKTVGSQIGGHLVPGQGWQADTVTDALDYVVPPCVSCTVSFDVTNVKNGTHYAEFDADLKWLSMTTPDDINGGFQAFRDSPWKMNLEVRSDGDGSGLQIIWRNGATDADTGGDPDLGDHTGKFNSGGPINGDLSHVYHVVVSWTATTYRITIDGVQWFPGAGDSGFFKDGHPYTPSPMMVELGCRSRAETMVEAIWRNVTINPN